MISQPTLALIRLAHGEAIALPAYETAGAAGMDLRAAVPASAWADASHSNVFTPGGPNHIPAAYRKILDEAVA